MKIVKYIIEETQKRFQKALDYRFYKILNNTLLLNVIKDGN